MSVDVRQPTVRRHAQATRTTRDVTITVERRGHTVVATDGQRVATLKAPSSPVAEELVRRIRFWAPLLEDLMATCERAHREHEWAKAFRASKRRIPDPRAWRLA